ncbi:MAG: hypothetical protein WB677_18840 [Xanthobacteraceae bacterium]
MGWGPGAFAAQPKLANYVLQCIARWTQTEIALGKLLAILLGLQPESAFAAVQMYLHLTNAEARRSVLSAAAEAMLDKDDHTLYEQVMKAIAPVRARRNDFAHGMWGASSELKDALLWIGGDDYIAYQTIMTGAIRKGETILSSAGMAHSKHQSAIMVYRQSDLKADMERAMQAMLAVSYLTDALHPYGKERDAMRRKLLALPLLQ